jgi:hypothetical protein
MAAERAVRTPAFNQIDLGPDRLAGAFRLASAVDHRGSFAVGDLPVLLLPVRIETRFFGEELRIRIYPDQIHLDQHEVELTAREEQLGRAYWNRRQRGDADGARESLTAEVDLRRAAWIARATKPVKPLENVQLPATRQKPRPARAALLPERWCAVGILNGRREFVAFGERVAQPLAFSPDFSDLTPFDPTGSKLPVDQGMAWMVDFDAAVTAGMALRVNVSGLDLITRGLTLVVLGIGGPDADHAALESLLRAHHYTDGLQVLAQGTPTNNTDDEVSGGLEAEDPAGFFARELDNQGLADPTRSSAALLARALGLNARGLVSRIPGAARDEDAEMLAMNRVLWPVTWGRYLSDLLAPETGPSIVAPDLQRTLRDHFVNYVRGGAPLPTLAIGPQPLGLLPIALRTRTAVTATDPTVALEGILLRLRERWRESLPAVPRLDPVDHTANEEALVEVLGTLAHPSRFVVRRLTWQFQIRTGLWKLLWDGISLPGNELALLGYIKYMTFSTIDSVREELDWLRDLREDPAAVGIDPAKVEDARTVLDAFISMTEQHLARQSPIDQWYPDRIDGVFDDSVTTDPKIFYADYGTATEDRRFTHPLVRGQGATTADYLLALRARVPLPPASGAARDAMPPALSEAFHKAEPLLYQLIDAVVGDVVPANGAAYRDSLSSLAALDERTLELRLRETLGLASHRLDAWLTSLDRRDLDRYREKDPRLRVGGFGWVEKLKPDARGTRESQGFIHAPSLAHATTAAVLRSAWNAHGTHDPKSSMAVDLRSSRVRDAVAILDGIREGQALGDILGCRFERELHDALLDYLIDDCRRRALESKGITRAPRGPVDGLDLAALYNGSGVKVALPDGRVFVVKADTEPTTPEERGLKRALDRMLTSLDAVSDVSIADSVHHLLLGNAARSSATLDAIATGSVAPPELHGLATPRPGASVAHRLMATLSSAKATLGWAASPRALVEPALEAWTAERLGSPARVRCAVTINGVRLTPTLADLIKLSPFSALDAVYEGLTGWTRRARAFARTLNPDPGGEATVETSREALGAALGGSEIPFGELGELAAALRNALGRARPLDARDIAVPGTALERRTNFTEAEGRLSTFQTGFTGAVAELARLLPKPAADKPRPTGTGGLDVVRAALQKIATFGMAAAIPTRGYIERERDALFRQAWAALDGAQKRLAAAAAIDATPRTTDDLRSRALSAKTQALLGKGALVLPTFTADVAAFDAALGASDALLGGDPARAVDWLRDVALVRPDAAALEDVLTMEELLADSAATRPVVGQLPFARGDKWAAKSAPADRHRGVACFLVLDRGGLAALAAGRPASGVVFDEWTEIVPAQEIVTGVALHHDSPSSRPPQVALVALPAADQQWSFDRILDTVLTAFEAAKLRAVDPDVLLAHGHQAPAIFPPGAIDAGPQNG